jgi:hypothetical protein
MVKDDQGHVLTRRFFSGDLDMMAFARIAAAAALVGFGTLALAPAADAQKAGGTCVNKAGEGTNSTVDGGKFQAWEAVLQAYDWNVWGAMMQSKQVIGNAPGVTVKNLKASCKPGGLGQTCVVQATLCR